MNREAVAKELLAAAGELAAVKVMDVGAYMDWAEEDLGSLGLLVHSLTDRVSNAEGATLDPRVLSSLGRLSKEVSRLEKAGSSVARAVSDVRKAASRAG